MIWCLCCELYCFDLCLVISKYIVRYSEREIMSKKVCFVPSCNNNSDDYPSKLFLTVPANINRRKQWFTAVKPRMLFHLAHALFCCEDHFNLEEDSSNWMYYKMMGTSIKLKPDVVPHKFISSPPKVPVESALTDSAKKRNQENLGKRRRPVEESCVRQIFPEECSPSKPDVNVKLSPSTSGQFIISSTNKPLNLKRSVGIQVKATKKNYRSVQTSTKSTKSVDMSTSPIHKKIFHRNAKGHSNIQGSPASASSTTSGSIDTEYINTSSSHESNSQEYTDTNSEMRRKTTVQLIEQNSKFYLGISENAYALVKFICEKEDLAYIDVLITLKKIRLGDTYYRLALDFGISTSSIQRIFVKSVPKIVNVLQNFIYWPKSDDIKKLLPIPFRAQYSHVQSIIDCFEIEIEKPLDPVMQASTWSEYKSCNTVKFLISCTPNGFINFISEGYGGRTSDKEIVENSIYLNELPEEVGVLADRGFKHIDALLQSKKCILVRPPTVSTHKKSSKEEVKESKVIASLRIHIERVIRRIREFSLLQPHACVNLHMVPLLNYIVIIACALINCQEPIIKM